MVEGGRRKKDLIERNNFFTQVDPRTEQELLIEMIRRDEFGIDVQLSEDGQKLMEKQKERLGRSLNRLSTDLYTKVGL